jgi:hypothetical protein
MLFPVPVQVAGGPDPPPEEEVATFFWVNDQGEIVTTIESVPIRNGVAVYNGDPLPHGAHWAITVHDVGGLPIFRSGPLARLPGPASEIALVSQIRVFRVSSGAAFGIDSPDGAPELVRQRLNSLPEALRVDSVKFSADDAGHEIVEVAGQLSILEFFSETFTHSLSLSLRPATGPSSGGDYYSRTRRTRFRCWRESRRLCGGARSGNCRRGYQRAQRGRHPDRRGPTCAFWSGHSRDARFGDPDRGNPDDGFGSANKRRGARRGYHRGRDCHRQRSLIPFKAFMSKS